MEMRTVYQYEDAYEVPACNVVDSHSGLQVAFKV